MKRRWRCARTEAGGGTTLTVRESGFLTKEHRDQNTEGWEHELGELRAHLSE